MFVSPNDGAIDASGFLNSTTGFLPVPILITEPAVGYGGGLAIAYFHKKRDDKEAKGLSPTVSVLAGALTENGTWLAAIAHQGSYAKDRIRYLGFFGYLAPKLAVYFGPNDILEGKFNFDLNGFATMHEVLYRVKKEIPFFAGANYTFFTNTVKFDTGINIPEFETFERDTNLAGMNASFLWDSRDNSFTPTKGIMSGLEIGRFATYFGGDTNFWSISSRTYAYVPIASKLFSGYRLNVASKTGDVPFYALPDISLRGIPMMRYQGANSYTIETEWRWNLYKRWSVVGFVGMGEAMKDYSQLGKDIKAAGGCGFRYLLAEDYGLHVGIDVARGPEIWAWNLTVGSNWFR
ncbi:BamA/TamA family outer membrane protein [Cognatitamlana onchidii]|uniref:BamA/TamA family outer membrane protein n=1 Tax=Cognatitamlana onchidii TaxID=2562860 RepID=UPI001455E363|nr:BamA/TamA family outer membrane protein [Algibacter onchidii]